MKFAFFIKRFLIFLNIFGHEILPADFIPIAKMINSTIGKQSNSIQSFIQKLFFAPIYIPFIILSPFIASSLHGLGDTIVKECFILYIRTILVRVYGCRGYDSFFMYLRKYSDICRQINKIYITINIIFIAIIHYHFCPSPIIFFSFYGLFSIYCVLICFSCHL